jgi:hypothetical protein
MTQPMSKRDHIAAELCRLNQCTEMCEFHGRWADSIAALSALRQGEG